MWIAAMQGGIKFQFLKRLLFLWSWKWSSSSSRSIPCPQGLFFSFNFLQLRFTWFSFIIMQGKESIHTHTVVVWKLQSQIYSTFVYLISSCLTWKENVVIATGRESRDQGSSDKFCAQVVLEKICPARASLWVGSACVYQ